VETWLLEHLVNYIMPTPYLHASLPKKWRKIGQVAILVSGRTFYCT
jgi:hypothetical protein